MSLNGEKHDMTPEERALQLIKELSLEEKMAQINCVFPFDKTYLDMDWIRNQIPYGSSGRKEDGAGSADRVA